MDITKEKIKQIGDDLKQSGVILGLRSRFIVLQAKVNNEASKEGNEDLWLRHRDVLTGYEMALEILERNLSLELRS